MYEYPSLSISITVHSSCCSVTCASAGCRPVTPCCTRQCTQTPYALLYQTVHSTCACAGCRPLRPCCTSYYARIVYNSSLSFWRGPRSVTQYTGQSAVITMPSWYGTVIYTRTYVYRCVRLFADECWCVLRTGLLIKSSRKLLTAEQIVPIVTRCWATYD